MVKYMNSMYNQQPQLASLASAMKAVVAKMAPVVVRAMSRMRRDLALIHSFHVGARSMLSEISHRLRKSRSYEDVGARARDEGVGVGVELGGVGLGDHPGEEVTEGHLGLVLVLCKRVKREGADRLALGMKAVSSAGSPCIPRTSGFWNSLFGLPPGTQLAGADIKHPVVFLDACFECLCYRRLHTGIL